MLLGIWSYWCICTYIHVYSIICWAWTTVMDIPVYLIGVSYKTGLPEYWDTAKAIRCIAVQFSILFFLLKSLGWIGEGALKGPSLTVKYWRTLPSVINVEWASNIRRHNQFSDIFAALPFWIDGMIDPTECLTSDQSFYSQVVSNSRNTPYIDLILLFRKWEAR